MLTVKLDNVLGAAASSPTPAGRANLAGLQLSTEVVSWPSTQIRSEKGPAPERLLGELLVSYRQGEKHPTQARLRLHIKAPAGSQCSRNISRGLLDTLWLEILWHSLRPLRPPWQNARDVVAGPLARSPNRSIPAPPPLAAGGRPDSCCRCPPTCSVACSDDPKRGLAPLCRRSASVPGEHPPLGETPLGMVMSRAVPTPAHCVEPSGLARLALPAPPSHQQLATAVADCRP